MATTSPNMGLTLPDINDRTADTIGALAENFTILDRLFPIGFIIQSTVYFDPAELYGGTWTRIEDRFPVYAGNSFPAGSTGGSMTHKHGKAEDGSSITTAAGVSGSYVIGKGNYTQAASSCPPYKAVYAWERTA